MQAAEAFYFYPLLRHEDGAGWVPLFLLVGAFCVKPPLIRAGRHAVLLFEYAKKVVAVRVPAASGDLLHRQGAAAQQPLRLQHP